MGRWHETEVLELDSLGSRKQKVHERTTNMAARAEVTAKRPAVKRQAWKDLGSHYKEIREVTPATALCGRSRIGARV